MSKVFYDHLIVLEDIVFELKKYNLDPLDLEDLVNLADQSLHHHTLNVILTHLPASKHETFMSQFKSAPHDQALLDFLRREIKIDVESAIRTQAQRIKSDILAEIAKAKFKK